MAIGSTIARWATVERSVWCAVLSALAWIPGGLTRFTFPKLAVLTVAVLLAQRVPPEARLGRPVRLILAAAGLVLLAAAVAGASPWAALVGRWPRYEGLPVLALYAAALWVGARSFAPRDPDLRTLVDALVVLGAALGVMAVLERFGWSPLGLADVERTGSLLGNATDQGLVAMMALLVLAPAWLAWRSSWILTGIAGSATALAMSGSRASLAVGVLGLIVIGARHRRRRLLPILVLLAGLILLVVAVPVTRDRLTSTGTIRARLIIWEMTGRLVQDHLLLGVGPSGYEDAIGHYETVRWTRWADAAVLDSPHSWPLQALVAGGVPLLLLAGGFATLVVSRGLRGEGPVRFGVLLAVVGYGVALLVNFTAAGSTVLAALLAGILLAEPLGPESPDRPRLRAGARGAAWLALLLGVTASWAERDLYSSLVLASQGRLVAASDAADRAMALRPYDPDVPRIAAPAFARAATLGQLPAAPIAERLARDALRRLPDSYQATVALGVSLTMQNRLTEAERVLSHAVRLAPARVDAYLQLAIVRVGLDDPVGARVQARKALAIHPGDRTALRIVRSLD